MSFNPDSEKQAQEVIFSRKTVKQSTSQKHLGIHLYKKTRFQRSYKREDY